LLLSVGLLEDVETMAGKGITQSSDSFVIGIIGMGDMGKMYARRLSDAGWR
jgi:prephenate dehydrogenase (NADP+)